MDFSLWSKKKQKKNSVPRDNKLLNQIYMVDVLGFGKFDHSKKFQKQTFHYGQKKNKKKNWDSES